MKHIEVVAAIIQKDNRILCTQRPNKGEVALKWEFPGGKIEDGEKKEDALVREIKEELNCDIRIDKFFTTVYHEYKSFKITMHSFLCEMKSEKFWLSEHISSKWLQISELHLLDWAPADQPIINKLQNKQFDIEV